MMVDVIKYFSNYAYYGYANVIRDIVRCLYFLNHKNTILYKSYQSFPLSIFNSLKEMSIVYHIISSINLIPYSSYLFETNIIFSRFLLRKNI